MTRTRWLTLAAVAFAFWYPTAMPAAPVPAADSPLAVVPEKAPIVLHLRGIERTKGRLFAMLEKALPDLAPGLRKQMEEGLKKALEGRQLKGLAPEGPVFVVFTELPKAGQQGPPMIAVAAKVTRYQDFLDGFLKEDERKALQKQEGGYSTTTIDGEELSFLERDGYAVVARQKEAAALFTEKKRGLDHKLGQDLAGRLLESDVSAYVDMETINRDYGAQIKQIREAMFSVFDQMSQPGSPFGKEAAEMMKHFYGGLFQAVEDSRDMVAGLDFEPEGVRFRQQITIGADSPSSAVLKDSRPAALEEAAKLPAGQMGYMEMRMEPSLLAAFQPWVAGVVAGDEDRAIKEALDEIRQAGAESYAASFSMPTRGLQVWRYKQPGKAVTASIKMFRALKPGASFQSSMLKEKPEVKVNARSHRGFKLTEVHLRWDFEKWASLPGGKETVEMMKKTLGEGTHIWFGTDGKVVVQVVAGDWEEAQTSFDRFLDGKDTVGEQKAYEQTRQRLPQKTTLVGIMDVGLYGHWIGKMMQAALQGQGKNIPAPEKPEAGKAYAGLAITLKPSQAGLDAWFPVAAVSEMRKAYEPLFKSLQNPPAEAPKPPAEGPNPGDR